MQPDDETARRAALGSMWSAKGVAGSRQRPPCATTAPRLPVMPVMPLTVDPPASIVTAGRICTGSHEVAIPGARLGDGDARAVARAAGGGEPNSTDCAQPLRTPPMPMARTAAVAPRAIT